MIAKDCELLAVNWGHRFKDVSRAPDPTFSGNLRGTFRAPCSPRRFDGAQQPNRIFKVPRSPRWSKLVHSNAGDFRSSDCDLLCDWLNPDLTTTVKATTDPFHDDHASFRFPLWKAYRVLPRVLSPESGVPNHPSLAGPRDTSLIIIFLLAFDLPPLNVL